MSNYIGLPVRPVKPFSVSVCIFPGLPMGSNEYTTDDVFVVEHDFRPDERDGIHVGCPNGDWIAITAERFAELFGLTALHALDRRLVMA